MKTTVTLLSSTANPIETVYACWEASRHNKPVMEPDLLAIRKLEDPALGEHMMQTFRQVLESAIPVAENVSFTFLLEGVSVALREQMVRHRIGTHFGDRLGVDIVPDLADSTWWAQSMRILPMGEFANNGAYDVPESLKKTCTCTTPKGWGVQTDRGDWLAKASGKGSEFYVVKDPHEATSWPNMEDCNMWRMNVVVPTQEPPYEQFRASSTRELPPDVMALHSQNQCCCEGPLVMVQGKHVPAEEFYREQMGWIQSAYNKLVKAGIPLEDARNLIPLGATSRITWTINLTALQHIVGKRGCWILQLGVWEPVIRGMIEALATRVHPIFRTLIAPPCVKGSKFIGCKFELDNTRRVEGEDEIPPCRLWISQEGARAVGIANTLAAGGKPTAWVPLTIAGGAQVRLKPNPQDPLRAARSQARSDTMAAAYGRLWGFDPDRGPAAPGGTLWEPPMAKASRPCNMPGCHPGHLCRDCTGRS